MPPSIPASFDWITFAYPPKASTQIKYATNAVDHTATYYATMCYFGDLKPTKNQAPSEDTSQDKAESGKNEQEEKDQKKDDAKKSQDKTKLDKAKKQKNDQQRGDTNASQGMKVPENPGQPDIEQETKSGNAPQTDNNVANTECKGKERKLPKTDEEVLAMVNSNKAGQSIALLDRAVAIKGTTTLWLAQQYVEKAYRGGVHQKHHPADLVGIELKEDTERDYEWITMLLNDCFHYTDSGQPDNYKRWLVYHPPPESDPPISPPSIKHGNFIGNVVEDNFYKVQGDKIAQSFPSYFKIASVTVNAAILASLRLMTDEIAGRELHQFLSREKYLDVKKSFQKTSPRIDIGDILGKKDQWRLALLENEDYTVKTSNKAQERAKDIRAKAEKEWTKRFRNELNQAEATEKRVFEPTYKLDPELSTSADEKMQPISEDAAPENEEAERRDGYLKALKDSIQKPPPAKGDTAGSSAKTPQSPQNAQGTSAGGKPQDLVKKPVAQQLMPPKVSTTVSGQEPSKSDNLTAHRESLVLRNSADPSVAKRGSGSLVDRQLKETKTSTGDKILDFIQIGGKKNKSG